jgi:hypothetical protein
MASIEHITTTEEMVLNPDCRGLRVARIEVFVKGEHYPREPGRIEVWNDPEFFDEVRDLIESAIPDRAGRCYWEYDETYDYWDTSCGEAFVLECGSPAGNELSYCPHCGKALVQKS